MWNDKETDIDFIGYDKIAETILEIVKENHLRPLTIGVYGDWGVGKSSILSLLQKRVMSLPAEERSKIHTIVFNGWLFQGFEDTKSALMETIVSDLARLQPLNKKVTTLAKTLLRRINWLKVAKVSAGALWTGFTGIPNPGALGGLVGVAANANKLFSGTPSEKQEITVETSDDPFLKEEENNIPTQIHSFRKEFKELIDSARIDQLIIMVDDLDRCLPKAVIDILEAIRLFLFVEGTVFVISADERMIEYAVKEHFPNLPTEYKEYTKNYLEKLIQIPIRIPMLNQVQTGNYIKFLMLQNHLDNHLESVQRIYQHFEGKKKHPYEMVELNYSIIREAMGGDSEELRKTLQVADQLYPVLSRGLKGNPRNTKRFLNTLFLRLKVAKIYGLDKVIQLDVLAKLMLLESFNTDHYNELIDEISKSEHGKSQRIQKYEDKIDLRSEEIDLQFQTWSSLTPSLKDADLRPYIFIAKEKAISLDQPQQLSPLLLSMLEKAKTNSLSQLNEFEKDLATITPQDAALLFQKLIALTPSNQNWMTQPNEFKGLYRIVKIFPSLEAKLLDDLASKPASKLGVWVISESAGLKTQEARTRFNELLEVWKQDGSKTLKSLAKQTEKFV